MANLREILFSHIFICIYAKKVVPSTSSPIDDGDPFESTVAFCGAYAKADIFLPSLAALLFYADTYPLMQPLSIRVKLIKLYFIWQKNIRTFAYVQFL